MAAYLLIGSQVDRLFHSLLAGLPGLHVHQGQYPAAFGCTLNSRILYLVATGPVCAELEALQAFSRQGNSQ